MIVKELIQILQEFDESCEINLSVNSEYITQLREVYPDNNKVILSDL